MITFTDRIAEVLRAHRFWPLGQGDCECGWEDTENPDILAHVAEQIAAEFMSWDFLMAPLNEHYPEDVFPTMEDRIDRDPGPRIISLIRHLNTAAAAQRIADAIEPSTDERCKS